MSNAKLNEYGRGLVSNGPVIGLTPDGLDQLRPKEVLFAVIITTANRVDVCKSA